MWLKWLPTAPSYSIRTTCVLCISTAGSSGEAQVNVTVEGGQPQPQPEEDGFLGVPYSAIA